VEDEKNQGKRDLEELPKRQTSGQKIWCYAVTGMRERLAIVYQTALEVAKSSEVPTSVHSACASLRDQRLEGCGLGFVEAEWVDSSAVIGCTDPLGQTGASSGLE